MNRHRDHTGKKKTRDHVSRLRVHKTYKDLREKIKNHYDELSPLIDEGEWKTVNNQEYLDISTPDYYTLGLLEGKHLKNRIKNLRRIVRAVANVYRSKGYSYNRFLEICKEYEDAIPNGYLLDDGLGTFIDELQGMADAINGVNFEDIFVQNCFIDIIYGLMLPRYKKYPKEFEFGCTSLGVKNPALPNPIIAGQNFDFNITFKPSLSFVRHKVGDHQGVFGLRMGGMLSLPAGINESKVAAFINIIKCTQEGEFTTPSAFRVRRSFRESQTAKRFLDLVHEGKKPAGFNLMISDPTHLFAVEATPNEHIEREIQEWWVSSNTYMSHKFQRKLILPKYSKHRQFYTENRLDYAYKHGITKKEFMEILADDPIISRNKKNPFESQTLAFITRDVFGLGNPTDDPHASIPDF